MQETDTRRLLAIYLRGFCLMFLHVGIVSLFVLWALQLGAAVFGETFDWRAIHFHVFLSLSFLALFPGQTFWTYRVVDARGRLHTIVGAPVPAPEDGGRGAGGPPG